MQGMCGAWRPSICTVTFISQSPSVCIFRFTVIAALCYRRSSSETVISLWQKKELSHWSEASLKSSYILSPPRILSHHNLDMTTNHDFYLPLNSLGDLSLIHHIFITAFWILTVRKMVLANNPHFSEIGGGWMRSCWCQWFLLKKGIMYSKYYLEYEWFTSHFQ